MPWSPKRWFKLEALNTDERYLELPRNLRLFATTLMMYVDGAGRALATPAVIREAFYEFDPDVEASEIGAMLDALQERHWLLQYVAGKRVILQINPAVLSEFLSIDGRDSRFPSPEPGPELAQRLAWGASGPGLAEGKGGVGEESDTPWWHAWMLDSELPPPQGCKKHRHNSPSDCGGCAGAGKIHKQFMTGEITHADAVEAWGGLPE